MNNLVQITGALVRTPELRYTPKGIVATTITIGGENTIVDNNGEIRQIPFYQNVEVIGRDALDLNEMPAGTGLAISGRLEFQTWTDEGGHKHSRLVVQATDIDALQNEINTEVDRAGGIRMSDNSSVTVTLKGNLTRDVEMSYTTEGHALVKLSMAVNDRWRDRNGEMQERVNFVDCALWRELAETHNSLAKGQPVRITGTLRVESWTNPDGEPRSKLTVTATTVTALQRRTNSQSVELEERVELENPKAKAARPTPPQRAAPANPPANTQRPPSKPSGSSANPRAKSQ
jgi:single-strand DNA-binding protein